MGQSTDAYVFYGYCWDDEQDFDTDMDEVVKAILKTRGHADPWDVHYVGNDYEAYKAWAATPEGNAETAAYAELKKQLETEIGVDWDSHCSGEYPMPLLHVRGTMTVAWRGSPSALDPAKFAVDPVWRERLDAFLASQGIEPPEGENQPGWWTASNWG